MESDYQLRFYYPPSWITDSLRSNVNYDNVELLSAIENYFGRFGLGVYADLPDLYITRDEVLMKGFARDFQKSLSSSSSPVPITADNIVEEEEKEGITVSGFERVQFGIYSSKLTGNSFYIRGVVVDEETGESIIGATIQIAGTSTGTVTDMNGNYGLVVPSGQNEILYRAVGKKTARRMVTSYENGKIDISLVDDINKIDQVTIIGQFNDKVNRMDGSERMNMVQLNKSIMILGEIDILKGLMTLPGVQSASEITTGYNVRGGSTDQNLVLLDDAPIMNMSHFFGFFSNINADVVEDAELYKSGIPSSMGGRISSILNINSKTGNYEKYSGQAGISPISAHATMNGPILKNKISFVAAGRSTYSDWILSRIDDARVRNSSASFYDIFGKVNMKLKENQNLYLTFYASHDYFRFDMFQTQEYSNLVLASGYNHQFGNKLFYEATITSSSYNFSVTDESIPATSAISSYRIDQYSLNNRFSWRRSRSLNFKFGLSGLLYNIQPGRRDPWGSGSIVAPLILDNERAVEASLYIQNEHTINSWLSLSYGLRYTAYASMGPGKIYEYNEGVTRSLASLKDSSMYSSGQLISFYSGPEFRFLGKIRTGARSSVKFSYNRTRQYIGLVSNTILPAPTDFWKLNNPHIIPQVGDMISLGYFQNVVLNPSNTFAFSVEAYYRNTLNVLDYKTGAKLFSNTHFETEIIQGINHSYGIEFQATRDKGDLTGWLNYSYARSLSMFQSEFPEETINDGEFFPTNYDKPHRMNLVANYDFYRRFRMSTNIYYSTGRPITLPVTSFNYRGSKRIQFSDRNQHRLPDFFRIDLTTTFEGNYKIDKAVHGSVSFSVVNLTGRTNPYSVFFAYNERARLQAYSLSIYGVPIFTITYNLKF